MSYADEYLNSTILESIHNCQCMQHCVSVEACYADSRVVEELESLTDGEVINYGYAGNSTS